MKKSGSMKSLLIVALVALLMSFAVTAQALPVAAIHYDEVDLGGGQWQYSYTLSNLSDPGYNLYDVFFFLDQSNSASLSAPVPAGWEGFSGTGVAEIYSLDPSYDLTPGSELSGFTFIFDFRVGNLAYGALFTDPENEWSAIYTEGVTTPNTPVPEPSTVLLLGAGFSIVGLLRKKAAVKKIARS